MPKDGNLYPAYVTRLYSQSLHVARRPDDKTPALITGRNPLHRRVEEVVNIQGALTDVHHRFRMKVSYIQYNTLHYTTLVDNVSV